MKCQVGVGLLGRAGAESGWAVWFHYVSRPKGFDSKIVKGLFELFLPKGTAVTNPWQISACLSLRRVCVLHLPVVYEGTLRDHVITRIRLTAAFDADPFCHLSDCLHAGSSCPDRCVLAAVTSEVVRWPPHGCHVPLPLFSCSERRARAAGDPTGRACILTTLFTGRAASAAATSG